MASKKLCDDTMAEEEVTIPFDQLSSEDIVAVFKHLSLDRDEYIAELRRLKFNGKRLARLDVAEDYSAAFNFLENYDLKFIMGELPRMISAGSIPAFIIRAKPLPVQVASNAPSAEIPPQGKSVNTSCVGALKSKVQRNNNSKKRGKQRKSDSEDSSEDSDDASSYDGSTQRDSASSAGEVTSLASRSDDEQETFATKFGVAIADGLKEGGVGRDAKAEKRYRQREKLINKLKKKFKEEVGGLVAEISLLALATQKEGEGFL